MSQRKERQSATEIMAAREAMEAKLPNNVSPLPFNDVLEGAEKALDEAMASIPVLEDEDFDFDVPSDEDLNEYLEEGAPPTEELPKGFDVECPCCGAIMFAEGDKLPESEKEALEMAVRHCMCTGAKELRQASEMNDKIDVLFGPESEERFGVKHTTEELMIMKRIASYVAQRKIKSVSIKLNANDNAVFLIKKDATVVRHTRAIKSESEV